MIIQKARCYFLYNVPAVEHLLTSEDEFEVGVNRSIIDRLGEHFEVKPAPVPGFYTYHYRTEHTPYRVTDPAVPADTCIPAEKLAGLDFYADLKLAHNIRVSWGFSLPLRGLGLVTLCLEVADPLPSALVSRLAGLYLNPDYAVIATAPVQRLWSWADTPPPDFVTPDDLARAIHHHFFTGCGLEVHRHRALRHEIQIPFTMVEVETEYDTQKMFLEKEARDLVELVFRPACWEVERASLDHARYILDDSRVWSVARDTLVVAAYEGSVCVKIRSFEADQLPEVSGFRLTDEASILHTFQVAISNYHFLRILDDLLDEELHRLIPVVHRHQGAVRTSLDDDQALLEIDDFVIRVSTLRFQVVELLEEVSNPDKLIDEEWHIVLLDKLTMALGTKAWFNSLDRRVANLRELTQTIENTYEKLTDLHIGRHIEGLNAHMVQMNVQSQKVEDRLQRAQPFFEALAAVEAINLLISIWFGSDHPLVTTTSQWFGLPVGLPGKILSTLTVGVTMFFLIALIRWIASRMRAASET